MDISFTKNKTNIMKADGKKSRIARTTTCRKVYSIVTKTNYGDPYPDEGVRYSHTRGFRRRKQIFNFQRRMYKTWKHNRKTQWKI